MRGTLAKILPEVKYYMRAKCSNCNWYGTADEHLSTEKSIVSYCYRFPPCIVNGCAEGIAEFPIVFADGGYICGEWRAKAKESGKTSANMRVTKRKSVASKRTAS